MTTIQVRTDADLKKKVQKILKESGLDMSSAVNAYLKQIVITESIPFRICTASGYKKMQNLQNKECVDDGS